jgi:hypothetical protein
MDKDQAQGALWSLYDAGPARFRSARRGKQPCLSAVSVESNEGKALLDDPRVLILTVRMML